MRLFLTILLLLATASCRQPEQPPVALPDNGELIVITRNSPTTFYENAQGVYAGLEYDLVNLFARELDLKVKFVVTQDLNQIVPSLQQHQAHFAAAGIGLPTTVPQGILFGPVYQTVQPQLVYNVERIMPKKPADIVGATIEIVSGSTHGTLLREIQKQYAQLQWREIAIPDSAELLEKISDGKLDFALADSNSVDLAKNFYPQLESAFDIGKEQSLGWMFTADRPELYKKAQAFFARISKDGTLKRLLDRYYGHVNRLEQADVENFLAKMHSTLPQYRKVFEQAQEVTDIDWRLLAALGYQESHWDPLATSPTGVRGIMMLTEDTADLMKVTDRLNPKQSIMAGAKYLVTLKDTVPERIAEPDRTWIALAAYNIGYGHLEDARVLAKRQKLNPDSWADLKKTLPLLSRGEYADQLKHGFARGGAPVIFVENIRTYYDILAKFEKAHKPQFPSLGQGISITKMER